MFFILSGLNILISNMNPIRIFAVKYFLHENNLTNSNRRLFRILLPGSENEAILSYTVLCRKVLRYKRYIKKFTSAFKECVNRCVNGRCVNEDNTYLCSCYFEYTGRNCRQCKINKF